MIKEYGFMVHCSKTLFLLLKHSDQLWGPSSLLFNSSGGYIPRGKVASAWAWPLTSI